MPVRERPIAPEVGETDRRAGLAAVIIFCVVIAAAAPVQLVYELATGSRLQEFDIFREVPSLANIEKYEDALAEEAIVAVISRPYVQWTTRLLMGQGNEKVVIGHDGWLFFRPSILYPTGPGFRTHYVQADATVRDWDPLPAILRFAEDLRARGIELVLVPIPSKAQVYPEKLTTLYDLDTGPPANVYAAEFYKRRLVDEAGVNVIDLAQELWDAKARGQVYHTLDTHWTPFGMKVFADALAARLKATYPWLAAPVREYGVEPVEVTNRGDIFDMLNLPPWSEMYPEYPITVERVIDRTTGRPAEPDPAAEVVLLGDSFTNVMSMAEMNWGDHAGFGEHMMLRLGRPLDVIARNGGAPSATRQDLARRKSLAGRKLVVWSIVTREFITPDSEWKIIPLPEGDKASVGGEIEVVAKVLVASEPPRPRVDPYSEAVTFTKYTVVSVESGEYSEGELLAAEWVMLDFELTRAAGYRPGDVHRLKLVPLADKEESDASVRQAKTLDDTDDFTLMPFWVVEMAEAGDE